MARRHVPDFMRHHAGQLRFIVRLQNQPGVYEEESPGQCERVHFFAIDHLDGERNLGVGVPHQVLTHAVYVFGDYRIVDDLGLAFHLGRQLLAQRNLFFERVEVDTLADVPISNLIGVFFRILSEHSAWRG